LFNPFPTERSRGQALLCALFIASSLLTACTPPQTAEPTATTRSSTHTPAASDTPSATSTVTAPPATHTPDVERFPLEATVWTETPNVPILTYHQFAPNYAEVSTAVKTRLEDFRAHLQSLYDHGYSLVPLEAWLEGDLSTAEGRRPLIFTMDDLFFNNQIRLDQNGNPSEETGLGILWHFAQEHPDFGFHAALFPNLGDKLYADPDDLGWEMELAQTIAWCTEHGAIPYNHFYTHPRLDETPTRWIVWQMETNDAYLRELLQMAGREDLIPKLGNILALPFGIWPQSPIAIDAMLEYATPEGKPVQAVMEVDYVYRPKFLPPPYSDSFDPHHVPRIVATQAAIDYLVENKRNFPQAVRCDLGRHPVEAFTSEASLRNVLSQGIRESDCPDGIYAVEGMIFQVEGTAVETLPIRPVSKDDAE
jgi:hypothetical protein